MEQSAARREARLFARYNPLGQRALAVFLVYVLLPYLLDWNGVFASEVQRQASFAAVPVRGTADDADVADGVEWRFDLYTAAGEYAACVTPDADAQGWRPGRVQGGSFGTLDFTLVRNGLYQLLLQVRSGGETRSASVSLALDSALKVGQFSFSEQDLVIPVAGMPITVVRTYDSLHPAAGEFGAGWTWALKDLDVVLDEERGPSACGLSIRLGGGRNLTLTLPDGRRATFACRIQQSGRFGYEAVWEAPPGVYATLRPTVSNQIVTLPGLFPYWQAAGPDTPLDNYDFPGWTLTLKDGTQYVLERPELGGCDQEDEEGNAFTVVAYGQPTLKRVLTRGGQRIEFALEQGLVQHYDAAGNPTRRLEFARDAAGRIVAVSDPARQGTGVPSLRYEYAGENLAKVHRLRDFDAQGQPVWTTTEYLYENAAHPHYLTGFKDARGVVPMTASYDASGRLTGTTDAYGNRIALTHDLGGRTETVYDRSGNPTTHRYDARGNVLETTDAYGQRTRYSYDDLDHELTVTDPLGNSTARSYDSQGNLLTDTDPLGNTISYSYDGWGNVTSVLSPEGHRTTLEHDGNGKLIATTDALGNTRRHVRDGDGRVAVQYDELGRVTGRFGYDPHGNLTSVSNATGVERHVSYDDRGRPLSASFLWVDPDNPANAREVGATIVYDEAGLATRIVDNDGAVRQARYDAVGQQIELIDRHGKSSYTRYDARGLEIEETDEHGAVMRTVYDADGRAVLVTDRHLPNETTNGTRSVYDRVGRLVRSERLAGVRVEIVDDPLNPGSQKSLLLGFDQMLSARQTAYDAAGQVIEATDALGNTTRYEYDAAGRRTATIDALGHRAETVYDAGGRVVLARDALGCETRYQYDALGRSVKTILPPAAAGEAPVELLTTYNEVDQRVAETDAQGRTRRFEYDARGALTAVELPEVADPEQGGAKVAPRYEFAYDRYGNLSLRRDPKGRETRLRYDYLGRQVSRRLPLGQTWATTYSDCNCGPETVTDAKGQIGHFVYDDYGRLSLQQWFASQQEYTALAPGKSAIREYDARGRQAAVREYAGPPGGQAARETIFDYDREGRTVQVASPEGTIHYEFDAATGRHVRTWTVNTDTRYEYDALNRLATVAACKRAGTPLASPATTSYSYDAAGNRTGIARANGVSSEYRYNARNQLVGVSHTRGGTLGAATLASYQYGLRPDGRRAQTVETHLDASGTAFTSTIRYTYDDLDRLVGELSQGDREAANFQAGYSYDLVGNRLNHATTRNAEGIDEATAYAYDANDRLLTATSNRHGATQFGYDANGSISSQVNATKSESYSFSYDLENLLAGADVHRLQKMTQSTVPVHIQAAYGYDREGTRVRSSQRTVFAEGTATVEDQGYLSDGNNPTGYAQVLEETLDTGTGAALFRGYTLGQEVLAQGSPGQDTLWFLRDGHGATRTLASGSGAVAARYDFDAFGNLLGGNPEVGQPSATSLLSASGRWDAALQMDYLRARYYQPGIGRFDRPDSSEGSAADPLSLHRYAFNHNDPVNRLDPSGNISLLEVQFVSAIQQTMQSMTLDQGKRTMEFIKNNIGESAALTTALAAIEVFEDVQMILGIVCLGVLGVQMAGMIGKSMVKFGAYAKYVTTNRTKLLRGFADKANEVWQAAMATLRGSPGFQLGIRFTTPNRSRLVFNGLEVRAVRDLSHISDATLRQMVKNGFAATDRNGNKIILHHHRQNPEGFIVEMPVRNHSINNPQQHPYGNAKGFGLTADERSEFDAWRIEYWKARAQEELGRRGLSP